MPQAKTCPRPEGRNEREHDMAKRKRDSSGSRKTKSSPGRVEPGTTGTKQGSHAAKVLLILVALALAYFLSLGNDFVYDDRYLILENDVVATPGNIEKAFGVQFYTGLGYYRPVPLLSFALEYRLWRGDPLGYHVTNLVLLIGVVILLYFLISRLSGRGREWPACLLALCFGLHPAVSSVGMALGARGDLLCMLFLMGAYLSYAHGKRAFYALALVLFGFALLSKETAVTLPIVLLLMELLGLTAYDARGRADRPQRHGGPDTGAPPTGAAPARADAGPARPYAIRAIALRQLPFWALLAAYMALRSVVLRGLPLEVTFDPATTLKSYLYLIQTSLTPAVSLAYEPMFQDWFSWPRLGLTAALAAAAVALWTIVEPRRRGPIVFWLAWGAVTFLPTSNIVGQETIFDERYTVLPMMGIVAAIGLLFYHAGRSARRYGRAKLALCLVLLAAFAAVTVNRGRTWSDDVTFFTQWQEASRANPRPRHHLGLVSWDKGRIDLAHNLFSEAVGLDPKYVPSLNMLGLSNATQGRLDEAISLYLRAIGLDPNYSAARFNLAGAYDAKGEPKNALPHYQAAASLDPQWKEAFFGVAKCNRELRRWEEAVINFRRVLRLDPTVAEAYFGLSEVYEEMGLPSQAVGLQRQGMQYAPRDPAAASRLARLLESAARQSGSDPAEGGTAEPPAEGP